MKNSLNFFDSLCASKHGSESFTYATMNRQHDLTDSEQQARAEQATRNVRKEQVGTRLSLRDVFAA